MSDIVDDLAERHVMMYTMDYIGKNYKDYFLTSIMNKKHQLEMLFRHYESNHELLVLWDNEDIS